MAAHHGKPYSRIIMTSDSGSPSGVLGSDAPIGNGEHGELVGARPIGIFDSGVGGLTVARSIIDQLPNESILYVGDTAHGPYGPLPIAEVRANALGVMDELVDSGVKLLTIACNSASAAVLRDARERYTARYGIPVIEVIQPAVRRAVSATRSGKIGVIGTSATVGCVWCSAGRWASQMSLPSWRGSCGTVGRSLWSTRRRGLGLPARYRLRGDPSWRSATGS